MQQFIKTLKQQKYFTLKADGYSMLPILYPGDLLYFQKTSFSKVRTNDIILVSKKGKMYIHRMIYKNDFIKLDKQYFIAKGDNNFNSDGKIYPKEVIAKVEKIKRNRQIIDLDNFYLTQSSIYMGEIIKIKRSFEKKRVEFIFLKGLPLHLYYEGTYPRRIYADCDVLVNRNTIRKTEQLFKQLGYRMHDASYSSRWKVSKENASGISYYKTKNNICVTIDLHFEIAFLMSQINRLNALYPNRFIDQMTDQFLKEKCDISIQGECLSVLSPSNLILYLTLHFFHHNHKGIHRLEMIDRIFRWYTKKSRMAIIRNLIRIISKYHLQNYTYPSFLLLKKYFRTPLPKQFLNSIYPQPDKIIFIKKIVNGNIFDGKARTESGIKRFENIFNLSMNPLFIKLLVFTDTRVILCMITVLKYFIKRYLFYFFNKQTYSKTG